MSNLPSLEQIRHERAKRNPLYWLRKCTLTENPLWREMGVPFQAAFPAKAYFDYLFGQFAQHKLLFIPKSRDMMTSWSAVGWCTHAAQWHKAFAIFQTLKDDKAQQLISYAACLLRNQDEYISRQNPVSSQTLSEIKFAGGGRILAVPGGQDQIRMYKPTIYLMDEAAFLPEAEQCFNATFASSPFCQIIAVSSAGPGWFGDQCAR